jgi:hypothetical protein
MVTKTQEEWDLMTPAEQKAHLVEEEKIVFGTDFKKIKGKPVEQGIGAPGRESENHFRAIEKYESKEAADKARAEAAARKKKEG